MAKFEQNRNPRIGNEIRSQGATPTSQAPQQPPTRTTTPVRNSAIPKVSSPQSGGRREVSHDQIARRAYEISISGSGGSELENWLRAEKELKGQ